MPTFSLALLPHPGHCVEGRVTSLPQAAWGLTAAVPSALPGCVGTHRRGHAVSQPLRSRCSWGEANDSGTLRGVRPGPDSGLGPVLQDGRPPRFESHILITLGSRTHLPAGKWVGGEGFVEPSASVLPEGAQAPVPTSPQSGRWGDPFTTRRCQSAFRPRALGLPLNVVLWEVPRSTLAPALRGLTSGPGDGALTLEPRGTRPAPGPHV